MAQADLIPILYNDAAIAVGAKVSDVVRAPFAGVLAGVKVWGAGIENGEITCSSQQSAQQIPGTDIAVDTEALSLNQPGDGVYFSHSSICILNQPCESGESYSINYPDGVGTAEANWLFVFSRVPVADGKYHLWKSVEDTVAAGSITAYGPTQLKTVSRLAGCFIRGAGGNNILMQVGSSGSQVEILPRAIAVDTDVEPIGSLFMINTDEIPDQISIVSHAGFTGVAQFYFVYE